MVMYAMAYPANIAKAVLRWILPGGTEGFNVLHFKRTDESDIGNTDCTNISEYLEDWYLNTNFQTQVNPTLRSLMNFATILVDITVTNCAEPPTAAYVNAVNTAGTLGSAPLPIESCVVISLAAPGAGRRNRGRIFLPAGDISQLGTNTGRLTTSAFINYSTCFLGLMYGFQETVYDWVINSIADAAPKTIIATSPHTTLHHQRRRNQ